MTRGRIQAVAMCLASCLLAAACTSENTGPSDAGTGAAPTTDGGDQPATTGTGAADLRTVEVVQDDYSIEGLPAEVELGTRVHVTNTSTSEMHELISIRLPAEELRSAAELMALSREELAVVLGSQMPDVIRISLPGSEEFPDVGDARFDQPGRHLVFCSIPIGADPEVIMESDRYTTGRYPEMYENTPSHYTRGEFTVVDVR